VASLLAVAAGCGGRSVETTVSCVYGDQDYPVGASFTSTDGCNTCTCTPQGAECTTSACACSDIQGNPEPFGVQFPAGDGCNTCSCSSTGRVCTHKTCIPQCTYDGQAYATGDEFPSVDGCNSCVCNAEGVACTERACAVDSGPPPTACTYAGQAYPLGVTFPAGDDCNECSCAADGGVACSEHTCTVACSYNGYVYEVGDQFPPIDGCPGYCTCTDAGVACPTCMAVDASVDAIAPPVTEAGPGNVGDAGAPIDGDATADGGSD
jgi:hypothetical protein